MGKTTSVTIRIWPELKQALKGLALEEQRSLASYIVLVLEGHVKAERRRSGVPPKEKMR